MPFLLRRDWDTVNQADQLKQHADVVLSIGIGRGVDQQELISIATNYLDVLQVATFDKLKGIIDPSFNKMCNPKKAEEFELEGGESN